MYKLAEDARPQLKLLLIATFATIVLWFIPFANYLVYPVRLFVTFIHEGSHALASLMTGGSVRSLSIAADGSGLVESLTTSWLSVLITSSAGYLGAIGFGTLLLFLIRRAYSARVTMVASAAFVGVMTILFGLLAPIWNLFAGEVSFASIAFTVISGTLLTAGLLAIAKYASDWWANFTMAFLAVQCLLNAFSDLSTLFFINAPLIGSPMHSDAANMAAATGIPSFVWVLVWIGISIVMVSIGLRVYAVRSRSGNSELPFED